MSEFYQQVLQYCQPYFGDGAKRFIDRQIIHHLSKTPETLDYSDKEELVKWIRISGALLIGPEKAAELVKKIIRL